jgi:excisionase family DNA binding protein
MKKKRTYNTRLIKATWPYTVQEIAALFAVHKNAPLRWLQEGLQANSDGRPYLIRGDELARFLNARQQSKKRTCKPGEFFCFKCRAAREAYLNIADIVIENPSRLRVKALCATCSTPVSKVQSVKKLPEIRKCFYVQQLEGLHIIEGDAPSVNSDLED